jgi:hypothetical protein
MLTCLDEAGGLYLGGLDQPPFLMLGGLSKLP